MNFEVALLRADSFKDEEQKLAAVEREIRGKGSGGEQRNN